MSAEWEHRTNLGRVVYDRPKHEFTLRDIERITKKIIENGPPEDPDPEKRRRWIVLLLSVIDNLSELLISVMLRPFYLDVLADDVVDAINSVVSRIVRELEEYLKKARGPVGIPGKGVF